MNKLMMMTGLLAVSAALPALAGTPCDEVKAGIAKKIEEKGVKAYTLDVLATAVVKDQKVVGSCEGGSKKIVYTRGAAKAEVKAAAAAPEAQAEAKK